MSLESGLIVMAIGGVVFAFLTKLSRIMTIKNLLGKNLKYEKAQEEYIREITIEFILSLLAWVIGLIATMSLLSRVAVHLFQLTSFVVILVSLEFLIEIIFLISGKAISMTASLEK